MLFYSITSPLISFSLALNNLLLSPVRFENPHFPPPHQLLISPIGILDKCLLIKIVLPIKYHFFNITDKTLFNKKDLMKFLIHKQTKYNWIWMLVAVHSLFNKQKSIQIIALIFLSFWFKEVLCLNFYLNLSFIQIKFKIYFQFQYSKIFMFFCLTSYLFY